jgi:archaetidylinositol phosphate synthase
VVETRVSLRMSRAEFAGAVKTGGSFLSPLETRLARAVLPRIPAWLETYHLTLLSLPWCLLAIASGYLARDDIRWLWLSSLTIALHYVTDFFDGKLGRYRNTGLVRWGFYMDHLLDYFFVGSLLIGYAMLLRPEAVYQMLCLLAVFCGFMMSSFLSVTATGKFSVTYLKFGPTEFRIALIVINTLLIRYGKDHLTKALPYVLCGAVLGLFIAVCCTQRAIWRREMGHRARKERSKR